MTTDEESVRFEVLPAKLKRDSSQRCQRPSTSMKLMSVPIGGLIPRVHVYFAEEWELELKTNAIIHASTRAGKLNADVRCRMSGAG